MTAAPPSSRNGARVALEYDGHDERERERSCRIMMIAPTHSLCSPTNKETTKKGQNASGQRAHFSVRPPMDLLGCAFACQITSALAE